MMTIGEANEAVASMEEPPHDRSFLGHPKGLGYLAFTEAWERFSFYGMQALLVAGRDAGLRRDSAPAIR